MSDLLLVTKKMAEVNMLGDIHDQLLEAKERLRQRQKLKAMLHEAQEILKKEQVARSRHERVLTKERADVEKLEGFSLTGLFYSILGTKKEQIEAEKQEYLAAKLKHEECTQALGDAQQDVERLYVELGEYRESEAEYNRLLEEKRRLLTQAGDQSAETLISLSERLADLEADRKELQEAISAGNTAKRSLDEVRSLLSSAANWGTWDLLGGGTISTWAKHSKIDSAKAQARVAQRRLRQFQEELADADRRLHISLGDIGGFSTFADFFFDGLIADWVVQSKIQNASGACDSAISKVNAALSECRRKLPETEQEINQLKAEWQRLIEEA